MGLFDTTTKKTDTKLYPGDKGYPGGITSFQVHSKGVHKEVTVSKDSNGNIVGVYARDLFLGIF